MSTFDAILDREFPGSLSDAEFIRRSADQLRPFGFTDDNAIACVATCRDEICEPVRALIHEQWGEAFNMSSLGGMVTVGRTGFDAFHAHAPRTFARRQHIYYAMPHLGIDARGELGRAGRRGIPEGSKACGALFAFMDELRQGPIEPELDFGDIEQSLLRRRLLDLMGSETAPGPAELARLAEQAIREDLEAGIAATVDPDEVDYAVFTGVQIHGPDRRDYVCPASGYAVVDGVRREL